MPGHAPRRCPRSGSSSAPRTASSGPSACSSGRSCGCAIRRRVYEIHLMKRLAGFDRRGWRPASPTTASPFPDFAGRTASAIYNDVDQIYLADPALLFDLRWTARLPRDRSPRGHLGDADRLRDDGPGGTLARLGEGQGPADQAGGRDAGTAGARSRPGWNARDLEYAAGRRSAPLHDPAPAALAARSREATRTTRIPWPVSGTSWSGRPTRRATASSRARDRARGSPRRWRVTVDRGRPGAARPQWTRR